MDHSDIKKIFDRLCPGVELDHGLTTVGPYRKGFLATNEAAAAVSPSGHLEPLIGVGPTEETALRAFADQVKTAEDLRALDLTW